MLTAWHKQGLPDMNSLSFGRLACNSVLSSAEERANVENDKTKFLAHSVGKTFFD